jgi:hypothetical protein
MMMMMMMMMIIIIIIVVAGIALYSDSLRAGRFGDRIPVGDEIFSAVQTGPGAHPVSCTMGTGYFQGVKWSELGADQPSPSIAEVANMLRLYLCLPSVSAQACREVTFII